MINANADSSPHCPCSPSRLAKSDEARASDARFGVTPGWERRLVAAAIFVYIITYAAVSLYRHWGLNSSGYDLAIQGQVLWNTARGRLFESSIEVDNFLGDHMALIAVLLAPLAWLPGWDVEWLLLFQTFALGWAAWPLYRLTLSETGDRIWSVVIPIAFLLYPLLGFINRYDFHFLAMSVPCLCWLLLSIRRGRMRAATFAAVLACMCREEVGIAVACIALHAAGRREWRTWGLSVGAIAFAWSITALLILIPYFRGGPSDTLERYAWLGTSNAEIVLTLVTSPLYVLGHIVADPYRIHTLAYLIWPLAFLHFLSPARLLCVAPSLLVCLLPDHASQNSIYYHYLAPVLPLLWWALIGGAARWTNWFRPARRRIAVPVAAGLLGAGVLTTFLLQPPPSMIVDSPCWQVRVGPPRANVAAFRAAAALLTPDDVVYATMALAPHLSHRCGLGIVGLPLKQQADVILLDVTDWRWFGWRPTYKALLVWLIENPDYGVQFWRDGIVLLRRGYRSDLDRAEILEVLERHAPAAADAGAPPPA